MAYEDLIQCKVREVYPTIEALEDQMKKFFVLVTLSIIMIQVKNTGRSFMKMKNILTI